MRTMKSTSKIIRIGLVFAFLLFLNSGFTPSGYEITIDVAPSVLNLQNQGQVVTVHTDVSYSLVTASTVYLNNVAINSWKADDRGNFVAKFLMEEIKALPFEIGEMNTLLLTGTTIGGLDFWGTEEIKIIDVVPAGKK